MEFQSLFKNTDKNNRKPNNSRKNKIKFYVMGPILKNTTIHFSLISFIIGKIDIANRFSFNRILCDDCLPTILLGHNFE